jgi:hypothetical protein
MEDRDTVLSDGVDYGTGIYRCSKVQTGEDYNLRLKGKKKTKLF